MGGTALAAFLNPRLVAGIGYFPTHLLIAAILAVMAALVWFRMKEAPGWTRSNAPVLPKLIDAAKTPVTWKMCFLYAVVFGGFVSFATYLPTYLRDVYSFDPSARRRPHRRLRARRRAGAAGGRRTRGQVRAQARGDRRPWPASRSSPGW